MQKLLPLAIVLVAATSAETARADIAIGAEAGALVRTGGFPGSKDFGFGFAGRLGYAIDLSILQLIPEIKVAYERVPLTRPNETDGVAAVTTNMLRPMAGVRVSIGIAFLAIVAFGHVGYAARLGGEQVDASGLVYEFGGGVDITTLPVIDFGIWGAFNQVRSGGG